MPLLLAGDIGGTKTALRLVHCEPECQEDRVPTLTTLAEDLYRSAEFPDLVPIIRQFLASTRDVDPDPDLAAACFGIAGPVIDNACEVTNLAWSLSGQRLAHELGIPKVQLINDFAAIGYGVLGLAASDVKTLQEGQPESTAPIAVLGAGTGLGEAFLVPCERGAHQVFGSEGGHVDFSPQSALEFQLLGYLREAMNLTHVSVERVVSGQGIAWIYEFLRTREPSLETPTMHDHFTTWQREIGREVKTVDLAAEVSRAAIRGDDYLCKQAMKLFVDAYGAEAGNLALKLLPRGGLYVAGGIAPKILPLIERGSFLEAFRNKGRLRPVLERIPVHVVLNPRVGLTGAALYAARCLPGTRSPNPSPGSGQPA